MNPKPGMGLPSHLTLCSTILVAAALWNSFAPAATPTPRLGENASPKAIPRTQAGAAVGSQCSGDGLTVTRTEQAARLRCAFQHLDGEVTCEGLCLTSTVPDQPNDSFRVKATAVERVGNYGLRQSAVSPPPSDLTGRHVVASQSGVPLLFPLQSKTLSTVGEISVDDQIVRFIRPRLVEEYSVSSKGLRQDFVVLEKLEGAGELHVRVTVTGARAEPIAGGVHPARNAGQAVNHERGNLLSHGVRLVLEKSGRKLAYSRLRVTDATGKELAARMEVRVRDGFLSVPNSESDAVERVPPTLAVVVDDAQSVYPIRIDPTFSDANWVSINSSIPGTDSFVNAAVLDDSGNLYIGGYFTVAGGIAANFIAKWNGSSWSSLGAGLNDPVSALAVSGNDLYVGGYFTRATNTGGDVVTVNRIAKWNGSSWSALGTGMNYQVLALAASGNDLFAGGVFTTAGDTTVNHIARWNGNNWAALGSGVNSTVYSLAASGGDIYAGGIFTTAINSGGQPITVNRVARWNGSSWSALGSGMDDIVNAVVVSGGDLYAGGWFKSAGGAPADYVAKWDGSSWSPLGSGVDDIVETLAVSGSDLYAGGYFTSAINGGGGAVTVNRLAKWNGASWWALDSGLNRGVQTLVVSGNRLYAGGEFTMAGGTPANFVTKWNLTNWVALGSGMNDTVQALATSDGDLYLGGRFTTAGTTVANYVSRWDGSNWWSLGQGMNGFVNALAAAGNDLYASGNFTRATNGGGGAITVNRIAKWNGNTWLALGEGLNGSVHALATAGSNLYAGGSFTGATNGGGGTITVNRIAKWDGNTWLALGEGLNGSVYALATAGSNLYAGGSFTRATNGGGAAVTCNAIARWNGSTWSALGPGMNQAVLSLIMADGDLYAGGGYLLVTSPVYDSQIAKWNGNAWSVLGHKVNGNVYALVVSGGRLYAGGDFTMATNNNGTVVAANGIVEWNGNSWSAIGSGLNSAALALSGSGSGFFVGGMFTTAGGRSSAYVAKWAPLAFSANTVTVTNGALRALLTGPDTNSVVVDGTTNLTDWTPLATNTLPSGGAWQLSLPAGTNGTQFYRARLGP